jgi:hypothetical protein
MMSTRDRATKQFASPGRRAGERDGLEIGAFVCDTAILVAIRSRGASKDSQNCWLRPFTQGRSRDDVVGDSARTTRRCDRRDEHDGGLPKRL